MRWVAAGKHPGVEQASNVLRADRTVGHAALRRFDLDHRLKPVEAARAVADDFDFGVASGRLALQFRGDAVGADGERAGIARNEDARGHG